uniref:HTH_48 domain-containing protein n=1 Tax=Caenorhabditis japonica TaxID=281687 RepID=A0A8R1IGB7_CAEJA
MDHFRPDRKHLRHVILFLFLSNLKVPEVHRCLVQVYKTEAAHENSIRIWFGKFENKDFFLDDASRSGLSVWWSVYGVHHWELLDEDKTVTAEYYSAQLQKDRAQLNLSPLKGHRVHYLHDNAKTTCGENNKVSAGNVQLDSSRSPTVLPRPCPLLIITRSRTCNDSLRELFSKQKVMSKIGLCHILHQKSQSFGGHVL